MRRVHYLKRVREYGNHRMILLLFFSKKEVLLSQANQQRWCGRAHTVLCYRRQCHHPRYIDLRLNQELLNGNLRSRSELCSFRRDSEEAREIHSFMGQR